MVNRIDQNISRDARNRRDRSNFPAKPSARSYNQQLNRLDDIIASLANAPENRRARQVTEWELLRRQTLRQAA